MSNGYFVTATGTDVGKTFVTGLLVKKWRDSGIDAGYYKAALSGAERHQGKLVAGDADSVKRTAGLFDSQDEMVSYIYETPVSPHLAARKEGNPAELSKILADFKAAQKRHEFLFVEGSGGILCPIRYDLKPGGKRIFLEDVMKALDLPLLIVTTAALGSINACLLTVEYAKSRGLRIRGILVNRYGESGNREMEDDNIFMMQELSGLEILSKVKPGDSRLGGDPF